ncbi:MAG: peptidoglycan editing factor PgeF [Azonexus sp.]|nr:peptidoglycan editing factor PgeF [Betaproteobacteria bacterium]MBK8918285.1 peptidoglycan editing factor PgeF [Betaproteobacteria bacterium]MBP6036165.1 peptidoglycan editing factor PgeF [Azonexus sp.]MBP6906688.1 peptidoglycan editing factor PgeF [Azonexus sp.]
MAPDWIVPDWPAPPAVRALQTTRDGGVSVGPYASLNLGDHVGDDAAAVRRNRERVQARLPGPALWLKQVHGTGVVDAASARPGVVADGAVAFRPGLVCAVMTADCLPILLCERGGSAVAAVHAGWRGLAAGVIEAGVAALARPGEECLAWIGPAIGAAHFEVGDEVRQAFAALDAGAQEAFAPAPGGKWLADLERLARRRLAAAGVEAIYGGGQCTAAQPERFFSHRRDGVSGRQGSFIWLAAPGV